MPRKKTFSESNDEMTSQLLQFQKKLFESVQDKIPFLERNATKSTMVLPMQYTDEVAAYVCDLKALQQLEASRGINWCRNIRCLTPIPVNNDGNSLAHAVSVYLFGIQDKAFYLRQLIYSMMFINQPPSQSELMERWRGDRKNVLRMIISSHPNYFDIEDEKDWAYYLGICSTHRDHKGEFSQLEGIHIFVLANIIARPIFVYAPRGPSDEETIRSIQLEGIYLPLLRKSNFEKSPVLLAYVNGKFLPLFSSEALSMQLWSMRPSAEAPHCAPIVRYDLTEMPIRFLKNDDIIIQQIRDTYLDVVDIPGAQGNVNAVMLKFRPPPAQSIELLWSMLANINTYIKEDRIKGLRQENIPPQPSQLKPCLRRKIYSCKSNGYVSANNLENEYCDECLNDYLVRKGNTKKRNQRIASPTLQQPVPKPRPRSIDKKCKNCRKKESVLNNLCQVCYDESVIEKFKAHDYVSMNMPNQGRAPPPQMSNCGNCGAPYEGNNQFALCPKCHQELKMKLQEQQRSSPVRAFAGAVGGDEVVYSFDRKKVLCNNPGCEEKISPHSDDLCQKHLDLLKKPVKILCKFCNKNQADDNDFDFCLNCLNEQEDMIAEVAKRNKKKNSFEDLRQQQNMNIGRGVVNHEPLEMADDFLESLPMVTVTSQNHNINYALPAKAFQQQPYEERKQFKQPTVYEGYRAPQNFGQQQGAVNWQQEIMNPVPERCMYCTQPALGNSGVCVGCGLAKNEEGQQKQHGFKCGNPDRPSCKNLVYNPNEFMCDECINEQREGMQNVVGQQEQWLPQQPAVNQRVNDQYQQQRQQRDPCKGFDCEFFANPEYDGYCSTCFFEVTKQYVKKKGIVRPREVHELNEIPPVGSGYIHYDVPQHSGGVNGGKMYPGVTQPPVAQLAYPQMQQPQVSPVRSYGNGNAPFQEQLECKNDDCDMFGRWEWNGYCSQCYKNFGVERD